MRIVYRGVIFIFNVGINNICDNVIIVIYIFVYFEFENYIIDVKKYILRMMC